MRNAFKKAFKIIMKDYNGNSNLYTKMELRILITLLMGMYCLLFEKKDSYPYSRETWSEK
jgi:hypothetical protein